MGTTTVGSTINISNSFAGGGTSGYSSLRGNNPFEEKTKEQLWQSPNNNKTVNTGNDPVYLLFDEIDNQPLGAIVKSYFKDMYNDAKTMLKSARKRNLAFN